jgi:hypothetical protein
MITVLLICRISFAQDWVIKNQDAYLYWGTTDKPLKIGWDAQPENAFVFNLYHYEHDVEMARGSTELNGVTFMLPRTGHYYVRVCAIADPGDIPLEENCSISIDATYAVVDGQPRAWWVYGHVAAPGPIIFE